MNRSLSLAALFFAAPFTLAQQIEPVISAPFAQVVLALTDERDRDDSNFFAETSFAVGGESLPVGGSPYYELAVYDTANPTTILNATAFESFGIEAAGRAGSNTIPLGGFTGETEATNSDPIGVYVAGVHHAEISGASITGVNRDSLKGSTNYSVISTSLANHKSTVGGAIADTFATVIRKRELTIGDATTPDVRLHLPAEVTASRKIRINVLNGALGLPAFLPDLGNIAQNLDDLSNDPSTSTIGGSLEIIPTIRDGGSAGTQTKMLISTGSSSTIVTPQTAIEIGIDLQQPPDLTSDMLNANSSAALGGVSEVNGYYVDEFILQTNQGDLVLEDFPLMIAELEDPYDGGIFGMNVFAGNDWVINPQRGNSHIGFGDIRINGVPLDQADPVEVDPVEPMAPVEVDPIEPTDPAVEPGVEPGIDPGLDPFLVDIDVLCREVALDVTSQDHFDTALSVQSILVGDADMDGQVGFTDFLILSAGYGQSDQSFTGGDFDCDGNVGFTDFLALSANFGESTQATAPVPEPHYPFVILMAGVLAIIRSLQCPRFTN